MHVHAYKAPVSVDCRPNNISISSWEHRMKTLSLHVWPLHDKMLWNGIFSAASLISYSVCVGAGWRPALTPQRSTDGGLNVSPQKRLLGEVKISCSSHKHYTALPNVQPRTNCFKNTPVILFCTSIRLGHSQETNSKGLKLCSAQDDVFYSMVQAYLEAYLVCGQSPKQFGSYISHTAINSVFM